MQAGAPPVVIPLSPTPAAAAGAGTAGPATVVGGENVVAILSEWLDSPDGDRRKELARILRRHLHQPVLEQALVRLRTSAAGRGREAVIAIEALAELRDRNAIPVLLERLSDDDDRLAQAAQAALRTLTRHDLGGARWRWSRWWREWKDRHRIEWLIDALTEKNAELRLEAAQELEELSGHYFGYHFDLGRREREEARRRWFDWWQNTGKASLS